MEWKLLEILEEKINETTSRIQTLAQENYKLKQKVEEKEQLVKTTLEQVTSFEEEKEIIKGKVENMLQKITQALE